MLEFTEQEYYDMVFSAIKKAGFFVLDWDTVMDYYYDDKSVEVCAKELIEDWS